MRAVGEPVGCGCPVEQAPEGGAQVVVFQLKGVPGVSGPGRRMLQDRVRGGGDARVVLGVQQVRVLELAVVAELFVSVVANGLQQPDAGLPVGVVVQADQACVDELLQAAPQPTDGVTLRVHHICGAGGSAGESLVSAA